MTLDELASQARCLLLDFDGPICSVFAGYPAAVVAARLHAIVRRYYGGQLPPDLAELGEDPLRTLVQVDAFGDEVLIRRVANACRDAEVAAIVSAVPTIGAAEVLKTAKSTGRGVVIVSNNAAAAIEAYLGRHHLVQYVDAISGRTEDMPLPRLKPSPYLLERAVAAVGVRPEAAIFVGDSTSDIQAGLAAGVTTIGYANKRGKDRRLAEAGAVSIIGSMSQLAHALEPGQARLMS